MQAIELEFYPIEGNAPEFVCNSCGSRFTADGYMGDVPVGEDAHFSVVVCSLKCVNEFQFHPRSDEYIAENIRRIVNHR